MRVTIARGRASGSWMAFFELVLAGGHTLVGLLAAMVLLAAVEAVVPRRERGTWHRLHVWPNLALTGITLATNVFLNAGLVLALASVNAAGYEPLDQLGAIGSAIVVVLVLDLAWYAAHRTMHRVPWLWRIHAVHHSDPAVDVTTTIRQHPAEGLVRYAFMGAAAIALGASPAAFAVYRTWSALQGLFIHANVRLPARVEAWLGLVLVTPRVHEMHHSRDVRETNSNYATITTLFDRLLGTFTSPRAGVRHGLSGHDDTRQQRALALLRAGVPAIALVVTTGCAHLPLAGSYAWCGEASEPALARALARRGFTLTDRDHADVLVALTVQTDVRYRLEGGYGGGSFDVPGPAPERTRRTLHLRLFDRRCGACAPVWHGRTAVWLDDPIDAVALPLRPSPRPSGGTAWACTTA